MLQSDYQRLFVGRGVVPGPAMNANGDVDSVASAESSSLESTHDENCDAVVKPAAVRFRSRAEHSLDQSSGFLPYAEENADGSHVQPILHREASGGSCSIEHGDTNSIAGRNAYPEKEARLPSASDVLKLVYQVASTVHVDDDDLGTLSEICLDNTEDSDNLIIDFPKSPYVCSNVNLIFTIIARLVKFYSASMIQFRSKTKHNILRLIRN